MTCVDRWAAWVAESELVPEAPTIGPVRPLVHARQIRALLFARIREYRARHGVQVHRGPSQDARSISAPSSTTSRQQAWDPKRHQITSSHATRLL